MISPLTPSLSAVNLKKQALCLNRNKGFHMRTMLLLPLIMILLGCSDPLQPMRDRVAQESIYAATAKITNLAGNSGGSGTVIDSSPLVSHVLSNNHVCEVAREGGIVSTQGGHYKGSVHSVQKSPSHDLCLLTVMTDLHAQTLLADAPPALLEDATVYGHPHLLPIVITKGHFSEKLIIQVQTGFEACTEADATDPQTGIICAVMGAIPVVKNYETILVTPTIMAGSSGSGVYDSNNHLAAVIFAGSGDLSYGFAVPYEYINNFLTKEIKLLPRLIPNNNINFRTASSASKRNEEFANLCKNEEKLKGNKLCTLVAPGDMIVK